MAGLDALGDEPALASPAPASTEASSGDASRSRKASGYPRNRTPASRGTKPERRCKLA